MYSNGKLKAHYKALPVGGFLHKQLIFSKISTDLLMLICTHLTLPWFWIYFSIALLLSQYKYANDAIH